MAVSHSVSQSRSQSGSHSAINKLQMENGLCFGNVSFHRQIAFERNALAHSSIALKHELHIIFIIAKG